MSISYFAGTESGIEQFALHIYGLSETNSTRNNQMKTVTSSDIILPGTMPTAIGVGHNTLFTPIRVFNVIAILAVVLGICIFRKLRKKLHDP